MSRTKLAISNPLVRAAAALSLLAMPAPALAVDDALPFSAPRDAASFDRALQCLTQAIYYEARSESADGQRAVAQVVLNRVRHRSYPNSVCGVVYQGSHRSTGCQFSFTCDGSMARGAQEGEAWSRAERVARAALSGYVYRPAGLALNYHTTAIRPYWAPSLIRHTVIGAHIFYRQPGNGGSIAAFDQAPSAIEPRPGVNIAASRTRRNEVAPTAYRYEAARVESARVERLRVERSVFEPPVSNRARRAQRAPAAATSQRRTQAQARQAPAPRGPRTSVEGGVRVARGRS